MGEVVRFVTEVVAALSAAYLIFSLKKWTTNRYLRNLLSFNSRQEVILVFTPQDERGLILPAIAIEDFMAMNNIYRALAMRHWEGQIRIRDVNNLTAVDKRKNLVIFSHEKVNRCAAEIMRELNNQGHREFRFEEVKSDSKRWKIVIDGDVTHEHMSPSYEQELKPGLPINDIAVIAKYNNPFEPDCKVLIIAGIRGIGTWGAAEHLRKKPEQVFRRKRGSGGFRKDGNFVALIEVKYQDADIVGTKLHQIIDIS